VELKIALLSAQRSDINPFPSIATMLLLNVCKQIDRQHEAEQH